MNKRVVTILLSCTFALAPIALFGSTFASWAVTDEADPFGLRVAISGDIQQVTFYTSHDGSSWGGTTVKNVIKDAKVDEVPSVSLSGYTFKGWVEGSAPSSTNYTSSYSSANILDMSIGADKTFYPILESNTDYVYVNDNFYQANVDVAINTNTLGATKLGKRYIGVSDIPNPAATWDSNRDLYSASGIYKFQNDDGGAMVYRKVGLKPNNQWLNWWDGGIPCFGIYAWDETDNSKNVSVHMGSGTTVYGYIPATYINFKFSRYSHNATSFQWGNESYNCKFDNSWWWNGSSTNKYTKDTIVLSMNQWSSWQDGWGSESSQWVAS